MNILKLWGNAKIRFGIKAGLAYGAIYYIAEQGVWRSSDEATAIFNRITENVKPYTKEVTKHIPIELPNLPARNELLFLMNYYWNRGVLASCKFLAELPENSSNWTNQGLEYISERLEIKGIFYSEVKEQISAMPVKSTTDTKSEPSKK